MEMLTSMIDAWGSFFRTVFTDGWDAWNGTGWAVNDTRSIITLFVFSFIPAAVLVAVGSVIGKFIRK